MSGEDVVETNLVMIKEVQVFRIPPRTSNRGYRAADWDVNQFLWKGRLRVVSYGEQCLVKLEDPATGQLFAQCRHDPNSNTVEQVTDSSRYFVIKVEDASSGKHAFLGLGFAERNDSFDFNVALQDHFKNLRQQKEKPIQQKESSVDFSLKEGAKININISGITAKRKPNSEAPKQEGASSVSEPPKDWVQF